MGYRYEGKTLAVDQGEADVVRTIFRVYLNTESIAQVQSQLKANGTQTRRGNDFSAQEPIFSAIASTSGELVHGDVKRQGNHPALISKVIFGKVQALKERNRNR